MTDIAGPPVLKLMARIESLEAAVASIKGASDD